MRHQFVAQLQQRANHFHACRRTYTEKKEHILVPCRFLFSSCESCIKANSKRDEQHCNKENIVKPVESGNFSFRHLHEWFRFSSRSNLLIWTIIFVRCPPSWNQMHIKAPFRIKRLTRQYVYETKLYLCIQVTYTTTQHQRVTAKKAPLAVSSTAITPSSKLVTVCTATKIARRLELCGLSLFDVVFFHIFFKIFPHFGSKVFVQQYVYRRHCQGLGCCQGRCLGLWCTWDFQYSIQRWGDAEHTIISISFRVFQRVNINWCRIPATAVKGRVWLTTVPSPILNIGCIPGTSNVTFPMSVLPAIWKVQSKLRKIGTKYLTALVMAISSENPHCTRAKPWKVITTRQHTNLKMFSSVSSSTPSWPAFSS